MHFDEGSKNFCQFSIFLLIGAAIAGIAISSSLPEQARSIQTTFVKYSACEIDRSEILFNIANGNDITGILENYQQCSTCFLQECKDPNFEKTRKIIEDPTLYEWYTSTNGYFSKTGILLDYYSSSTINLQLVIENLYDVETSLRNVTAFYAAWERSLSTFIYIWSSLLVAFSVLLYYGVYHRTLEPCDKYCQEIAQIMRLLPSDYKSQEPTILEYIAKHYKQQYDDVDLPEAQ